MTARLLAPVAVPPRIVQQPAVTWADGTTYPARSVSDYWAAVTDVPCPACQRGLVRWAEAGYVPGHRVCDGCGQVWFAAGNASRPALAPACEMQRGCVGPAADGQRVRPYRTDGQYAPPRRRIYESIRATIPACEAVITAGGTVTRPGGIERCIPIMVGADSWTLVFRRLPREAILVTTPSGVALRLRHEPPYPGERRRGLRCV